MIPAIRMNFTDSQLIALSTIIENKNQFIRSDLIKSMKTPVRTNFSSEIAIPLEKNKSLRTIKLPKTKKRGRPGSVMVVTSNPWILEDIYQAMNVRAYQYAFNAQKYEGTYKKYQDMLNGEQSLSIDDRARWKESREKKRFHFSKYVEWAKRAALFILHCRDCGLQFPSLNDSSPDDKEFTEYYDVLYDHKIE